MYNQPRGACLPIMASGTRPLFGDHVACSGDEIGCEPEILAARGGRPRWKKGWMVGCFETRWGRRASAFVTVWWCDTSTQ
eukprot:5081711-Prymnesium_polylepis.1